MISIYDANNYVRKELETDITGLAPRSILAKVEAKPNPVVFVWDGPRGNARRRKLFDQYKLNRKPLNREIVVGFDLIEEVLRYSKAIQVKVPDYEGDDVIATLTRHYASAGEQVEIYSNDMDYLQLAGEFPGKVFCGCNPKVPAHLVRYYKICVGDPSDNIPGIPGFGQKTWDMVDKDKLVRWVDTILTMQKVGDIGLPPRIKVNVDDVIKYAKIVDFFNVPMDLISEHMTVGVSDYAAADAHLKRFMQ